MVCSTVCARAHVFPCPEVLSTRHNPEHFPSFMIIANQGPWSLTPEYHFLHFSALFLPVESMQQSKWRGMKEDYYYSACYMLSESLYAHISFTHGVKTQVKKCKRDLWPSIYCSSACSCQKHLVFLQV